MKSTKVLRVNWSGAVANIIVTGASRGLGLAIAKRVIKDGFSVAAVSRNLSSELEALLKVAGGSSCFVQHDFSDTKGLDLVAKDISRRMGSIYGLVNNAAMGLSGMLVTQNPERIEELVKVNLTSPMLFTRAVLRGMIASGPGRIINVSSINAFTGYNGLAAYAATKSGLIGFTRSLAREVGKSGITVNTVAPGFLETDMSQSITDGRREQIVKRSPLKRFAHVEEVAAAVSYLLSDAAAGVTGITLTVDAGNSA